jgi:hypothetical protein
MFHMYGFDKVAVVFGDLYFHDRGPVAEALEQGAERGVRLELRLLESTTPGESVYSSRRLIADRPVWRVDLLETLTGEPGSLDRTHHHTKNTGWDFGGRQFDPGLRSAPIDWLKEKLSDLDAILVMCGFSPEVAGPEDGKNLRDSVPQIVECIETLFSQIRAGHAALAPEFDSSRVLTRTGWL